MLAHVGGDVVVGAGGQLLEPLAELVLSLAVRDELTGLYVMRYISTFLSQALNYSRTFKKPFSVILLDVDGCKKINDTFKCVFSSDWNNHNSGICTESIYNRLNSRSIIGT